MLSSGVLLVTPQNFTCFTAFHKSFRTHTYKKAENNSFRSHTYKKRGEGGLYRVASQRATDLS